MPVTGVQTCALPISDDEYADQRELAINEFFVAMTRARDQLIVSFGDEPSEVLVGVMGDFDVVAPEDL
jgi:hypothetical protein